MMRDILFVAFGGAAGSAARYVLSRYIGEALCSGFPWPTFVVNVAGCLVIGVLSGLVSSDALPLSLRLLLITGFCGGFTTFSTFASENLMLLRAGNVLYTSLYIGASVTCGILAAYAGMRIVRFFG